MNVSKQLSGEHNNVGQMAVSPTAGDKQQCRDKPIDKLFLADCIYCTYWESSF